MTYSYSWVLSQLDCYPEHEGRENVVFAVHWRRQATDGKGHVADIYGVEAVNLPPSASFTPFDELTKEQVIGWIESCITVERIADIDAALARKIDAQINPPIVAPPLPWSI